MKKIYDLNSQRLVYRPGLVARPREQIDTRAKMLVLVGRELT